MKNEDTVQPAYRSHLFTVRLWLEELGEGQTEWRGQVQHLLSGKAHYFRDWPTLVEVMIAMVPRSEDSEVSAKSD